MPKLIAPSIGLNYGFPYRTPQADPLLDRNFKLLDTLLFLEVINRSTTAPPGSPANGDRYIIGPAATGEWTGKTDQVVCRINGAWEYFPPRTGFIAIDRSDGIAYRYDATLPGWTATGAKASAGNAGGDLGSTYPNPTVTGFRGIPLQAVAPTNGQGWFYNLSNARYEPGTGGVNTDFGASGSLHAHGLVPDPGSTAGTKKFLCEDATFKTPNNLDNITVDLHTAAPTDGQVLLYNAAGNKIIPSMIPDFVASGGSHAHGLVPDPGSVAATSRYLREDGTWAALPASLAGFVGVRAMTAGGQSLTSGTTTLFLECELVDYDTHAQHLIATSTDKQRLICKVAGWYFVWGSCAIDTNTTNRRWMAITKNDSTFFPADDSPGVTGDWTDLNVSTVMRLEVGDYVNFPVFQNSGSTLTTKDGQMGMYLVGAGPNFNYTGCRVTRVTDQSISASTNTAINFTGEDWDTSNFHDNSTNNTRMTVPVSGKYRIWARLPFDNNGTGTIRILALVKNGGSLSTGVNVMAQHRHNPMSSDLTYLYVDVTEDLVAGDYVEVHVFQNTSGALNVKYFLGIHVRAGMELLGASRLGYTISQDTAPDVIPAENDEFESVALDAKWTVVTNTAASVLHNSTFKSILAVMFSGNQEYKIRQALVPGSADFAITSKFHCAPTTDFNALGFYIGDSTDANLVQCFIGNQSGSGGLTIGVHKTVTSVQTNNIGLKAFDAGSISQAYIHAQRVGGNYSVWYSLDGVAWFNLVTAYTPGATLTVARLTIDFGMFGATNKIMMGVDFIRRDWFMHP